MPLTTDAEWFHRAVHALYQAAVKTRNSQGLLVQPPGHAEQCRALVRGALSTLFNGAVSVSDEFEFRGLPPLSLRDGINER